MSDGRKSFTEIAKECGESKANISKRYKNLEKTGIIVGSTIQLDYSSLGYNAVGNIDFKINPENSDAAVDKLNSIPNIYHAFKIPNGSKINVVVTLRNMEEFNRIKDFTKGLPSVTDIVTNVWMGIRNIPENLAIIEEHDSCAKYSNQPIVKHSIDIDDNDKRLIEKLARNGRIPFDSIAKELNIGTNTVINKFNKLKENGIIKVSIQINPRKLGYKASARFNLAFHGESESSVVAEKLTALSDVFLIIKTSGIFDLAVFTLSRDLDQLLTQQEEMYKIAEISKMDFVLGRSHTILPGYKEYISTF